jgi:ArsR family transcriptional regulator
MMTTSGLPVCKVVCLNKEKISALKKRIPSRRALEVIAGRHKALGHPMRQAILHVLAVEECCVCDLANVLELPISTVSQHLRALRSVELLCSRQEGKLVFYSLTTPQVLQESKDGKLVTVKNLR